MCFGDKRILGGVGFSLPLVKDVFFGLLEFLLLSVSFLLLELEVMQSYPARALDRKLQVDWARDAREGPRVLMSLRVDFGPMG